MKPLTNKIIAGLSLLFFSSASLHALDVYVTTDKNSKDAEPPFGGGKGWTKVGKAGTTVNAGETFWLACRNSYNKELNKAWTIELTSTGAATDVNSDNLHCPPEDVPSVYGFDPAGTQIEPWASGDSFYKGVRFLHCELKPQPLWERMELKNYGKAPISFTIETSTTCEKWTISNNSLQVPTCFFGYVEPGIPPTNQFITQVLVFPQTVALDPSVAPTFVAPTNSGQWTASAVYADPTGNSCPLGGILFQSDGPGLDSSEACGFSFSMQGAAADLQYTLYAYDELAAEYQQFALDLRPTLAVSSTNNTVGLQFNSVLGLTYTLEGSLDLQSWQPIQPFVGTGDYMNTLSPINGPVGFFRLRCDPSTPPALSAISALPFTNSILLTFNEPVNAATAANRANYFVGMGSSPIMIQNIIQVRPTAVRLVLNSPVMPGTNYFLGLRGLADDAGNVMKPTNATFTAATVQNPCPGGTLLSKQAYSECNPDGFWHVVEDDWYQCPDGTTQKFRVADTKTTQPCGAPAPNPAGLLYPTAADVSTTCQSPIYVGKVIINECVGGLWSASTYMLYKCLDGTFYLSGPVQNVPVNPPTGCTQPPPPPSPM